MFELKEDETGLTFSFKETQDTFFQHMLVVGFLAAAGLFLYFIGVPRFKSGAPYAGLTSLGLAALMFLYAVITNPIRFITTRFDNRARTVFLHRKWRRGERTLEIAYDDVGKLACVTKEMKQAQITFLTLTRGDGRSFRLARLFGDPSDVRAAVDRLSAELGLRAAPSSAIGRLASRLFGRRPPKT